MKRRLVLITGASTGLGLALAQRLIASDKYILVLTAREQSMSRFQENGIRESLNIMLRPLDVTNRNQRISVVNECERLGGLDVLINNAGLAMRSVAEDASASDRSEILNINYISPMRLAALALPSMRQRRSGHIVNISSAAGLVGMPTMACYCGSKFALEGGTESMWYEVRPWNVNVSLIIPGFIRSDAVEKTRLTREAQLAIRNPADSPYSIHYQEMAKMISWIAQHTYATPQTIAAKIERVIEMKRPPLRVPVTWDAWVLYLTRRFLPRALYHTLLIKFLPHTQRWGKVSVAPKCQLQDPYLKSNT